MGAGALSVDALGRAFIDAFNRRDADALVRLCDPQIDFHPSSLVGARHVYRGHDGIRRWVAELERATVQHEVRVREVRELGGSRFLVVSEVYVDGELLSPSAMLACLGADGRITEAHSYLSDADLIGQLDLAPTPAEVSPGEPGSGEPPTITAPAEP